MWTFEGEGSQIRLFSGSYQDKTAETENVAPVMMLEMNLEEGATVIPQLPGSFNGFCMFWRAQECLARIKRLGDKGRFSG